MRPNDRLTSGRHSVNLRFTIVTVLASTIAYKVTLALGFTTGYWAAITAAVVCQSEIDTTVRASRDRLIGTALGVVVGWITALTWHNYVLVFAVALFGTLTLCNWLRLEAAGRLAVVALSIVVLVQRADPVWRVALARFGEVSVGIVAALLVTMVVRPHSARLPA